MFTLLYCKDTDIPVTSLPDGKVSDKSETAIELRKELDYSCIRGELHKESAFMWRSVAICPCYATVCLFGALFKMSAKMTRFSN